MSGRDVLSGSFARLWWATAVSNVGNGVSRAAGPLLMVSLTTDPRLVAGAAVAQQLPWLLLALPLGAVVDRIDRVRLVVLVDVVRGLVLGALAAAVLADVATVPLVLVALFVMGVGEVVADNSAVALGAALFAVGAAVPFGFDALTFLVAAALVATIRPRRSGARPAADDTGLVEQVRAGLCTRSCGVSSPSRCANGWYPTNCSGG